MTIESADNVEPARLHARIFNTTCCWPGCPRRAASMVLTDEGGSIGVYCAPHTDEVIEVGAPPPPSIDVLL